MIKSGLDLTLALLGVIILSPIILVTALIILIFDGPPILFRQKRVGFEGRPFVLLKFRSMKPNNKLQSKHNYDWDVKEGVPDDFVFKSSSGSEVTKIGYLLRKLSLDELPQLINVIKGEMSLVGPRPEIPEIAQYYNQYQKLRLKVKPGITGLAQINGRANLPHGEKIKNDLSYIKNWSLALDLQIIFKTILKAIRSDGAY